MGIQCWQDLLKYGAGDVLEKEYGEWLVRDGENREADYDMSLMIDLEKIPEEGGGSSRLVSSRPVAQKRSEPISDLLTSITQLLQMLDSPSSPTSRPSNPPSSLLPSTSPSPPNPPSTPPIPPPIKPVKLIKSRLKKVE